MIRIIEFLAAYFRRGTARVVERRIADGTSVRMVESDRPLGVAALNAMLDEHYADARAVVDAGRLDPPTTVLTIDPAPIAPAPPAETGVNVDLLRRVLVHITENPDDWDQWTWWELNARSSCGTTGCFAGWAVHFTHPGARRDFLAGEVEVGGELQHIQYVARRALRLTPTQATGLFSANNTLRDLWVQAEYLSNGAIVPPAELPDGS